MPKSATLDDKHWCGTGIKVKKSERKRPDGPDIVTPTCQLQTFKFYIPTMRELLQHKLSGVNEALTINVTDEPGQGGACHRYEVTGFDELKNPSHTADDSSALGTLVILFQNGPLKEAGVNGITQEALLAILIDRLESFQAGKFTCQDNDDALWHVREALTCLQKRTRERLARGVEGTNVK